jgi:hypothetical protein
MRDQPEHDTLRPPLATTQEKKAYGKPVLTTYGEVRQFTQGSGGTMKDGKGSMAKV